MRRIFPLKYNDSKVQKVNLKYLICQILFTLDLFISV